MSAPCGLKHAAILAQLSFLFLSAARMARFISPAVSSCRGGCCGTASCRVSAASAATGSATAAAAWLSRECCCQTRLVCRGSRAAVLRLLMLPCKLCKEASHCGACQGHGGGSAAAAKAAGCSACCPAAEAGVVRMTCANGCTTLLLASLTPSMEGHLGLLRLGNLLPVVQVHLVQRIRCNRLLGALLAVGVHNFDALPDKKLSSPCISLRLLQHSCRVWQALSRPCCRPSSAKEASRA